MTPSKDVARKLQREFPGVSSYSTILSLVTLKGEEHARTILQKWQEAGTTAPRRG